jgi:outer membrane receptor protein involved in Fe transport
MSGTKLNAGPSGPTALAAAVSAAVAGTGEALAQEAGGLDEIIVTATRRAEQLQDVPASVSAFDTDAIALRGLQQMDDYAKFIPGLSLGQREPGGTTIVFRGVASSGLSFGSVSSAGLYLDEQPITSSGRNPDPRLIDIERIEALRGPQGTLFGASSQSGTLRVITNKPDPTAFDAWAEGALTQTHDGEPGYDFSGAVNMPLAKDKIALRLVGFRTEDAGFIDNVLSNSQGGTFDNANQAEDDVNSATTTGGRAALRWDISEDVDLTVAAIFQELEADANGDVNPDNAGDRQQVRFEKEPLDDKWYQLALTVNARLPFADAMFTTAYFDRDFRYENDATDYEFAFNQRAIAYDNVIYDFGGDPRGFAVNNEKTETTTFEARLASLADDTSRWSWLVGAFYSEDEGNTSFDSNVRNYSDTPSFEFFDTNYDIEPTDTWFLGRYETELEELAVFGEVSFDITENFTITAGARWFDYDRSFTQHQEQPKGLAVLDDNQSTSESGTVGRFNATWRLDEDKLVYFTYSEGFRVGGASPVRPESLLPSSYDSDELQNYEIGAKTDWLDNRLRVNVAAYYMEWDDFAVQIEDPQPGVFQLGFVNFPTAEISGVEAEFAFALTDHWQLDGALGWNDAEIAEASTFTVTDDTNTSYSFTVTDGARLPLTPDWTATLGVEFRPDMTFMGGEPFARFDYAYVGDSVNSLEGIESVVSGNPVYEHPSYQTGDFRVGVQTEAWTASLFVDNVWDEEAEIFMNNRWAVRRLSVNRPRTVGVQFRYEF